MRIMAHPLFTLPEMLLPEAPAPATSTPRR